MKLIPPSFFANKKAIYSTIAGAIVGMLYTTFSAHKTYNTYKVYGEFHGGENGEFISYGRDAAFPAYGLTLTYILASLYSAYLLICMVQYLIRGDYAANSVTTGFFCCKECKAALQSSQIQEGICINCGGDVIDLEEYKRACPEVIHTIDYTQVSLPEKVIESWSKNELVFTVIFVCMFIAFHIWAYYANITAN